MTPPVPHCPHCPAVATAPPGGRVNDPGTVWSVACPVHWSTWCHHHTAAPQAVEHRFGDYTPTGPGFGMAPRGPQPRNATRHAAWSIAIAALIIVLFVAYSVAKYG